MSFLDKIKRWGEIAGATAAIYAVVVGILIALGAHVPPWYSIAEAQTLEQSLKQYEAAQERRDKATQANIDLLLLSNLRAEAEKADMKVAAHPKDASAKADAWFARQRLIVFFKAHPNLASAMGQ